MAFGLEMIFRTTLKAPKYPAFVHKTDEISNSFVILFEKGIHISVWKDGVSL